MIWKLGVFFIAMGMVKMCIAAVKAARKEQ